MTKSDAIRFYITKSRKCIAMSDDELIAAMLGPDLAFAYLAKQIYDRRHANDPQPKEPAHCAECFEGCPKCQPNQP